jgi:hypothetical protein
MLTAITSAVVLLLTGSASAAGPVWQVAPQIIKEANEVVLTGVSVLTADDVWVVGTWTTDARHPFAVHWTGRTWFIEPTPDPTDPADGISGSGLNAIDAVSPEDLWAVGDIQSPNSNVKTMPLLLHYDGHWSQVPGPAGLSGELTDIDLLTADEGWAVGDGGSQPLILRRTAGQWLQAQTPPVATPSSLASVYAISPTDAWAVGTQLRDGHPAALVLHWDGMQWSESVVPAGISDGTFNDVAASSATDVWAVGSQCASLQCGSRVLHLTKDGWRSEAASAQATLTAVVALSPADVWIFGQSTWTGAARDHIEHWDGTVFTVDLSAPLADTHGNPVGTNGDHPGSALALAAAGVDPFTGTIWAVGWIQSAQRAAHAIFRR